MSKQEIIQGNSLEVLKSMDSESVDVCVTSPPYWAVRDYGTEPVSWGDWDGQLGLEPNPKDYVSHLCNLFDEVKRVLKPTGSCFVNIGDTYACVGGHVYDTKKSSKISSSAISASAIKDMCVDYGFKPKSLMQIPSRFAIEMCDRGWILRNEIIWQKPNVMPTSIRDRFTVSYEKMFFFTKEHKYYFKQQLEPTTSSSKSTKQGMRNMRDIWSIPTRASTEAHVAMFPQELIATPIDACCPEGGVVLDPFCGSGTTLLYCKQHNISAKGIELNPDYVSMIKRRLDSENQTILDSFV